MPKADNNPKCPYKADDNIEKLPLIGPKYAQKLENLEIYTIKDLLFHFPYRYKDTSDIIDIKKIKNQDTGTILATIDSIKNIRTKSGRWLTKAQVSDHSGSLEIVWFNQPYLAKSLKVGDAYIFDGKINRKWGGPSLTNPQYEKLNSPTQNLSESKSTPQTIPSDAKTTHLGKLTPRYPETKGVSSKWLRARIKPLKKYIPSLISEYIRSNIRKKHKIISLPTAIKKIHFPQEIEDIEKSEYRLGLDELIKVQIKIRKLNKKRQKFKAPTIDINLDIINKLQDSLSYTLTNSQQNAIKEIVQDLQSTDPMYRLLNGDVGSGKTIVALHAALTTYKSDYTTIIMAPTTILANQHYQNIKKTCKNANIQIPIKLITSDQKQDIDPKTPQIIIATHAILYKNQLPSNIGLLIVDEEHRFGVEQRQKLKQITTKTKKDKKTMPHYLTMTATPIPRTLTLALYGQTNVSTLDELPPNRKTTKTYLVQSYKRNDCYKWIKDKLKSGEQAFVICPLVEDSDKVDAKSAQQEYNRLQNEIFPDQKVGLIHGQLSEEKKDQILHSFDKKEISILVATPVIEVGIDIQDATIMLIENAERFGLAQLHQLRGRIGRGDKQGHCFLFTKYSKQDDTSEESQNPEAQKRLQFFSKTNNGFEVAEYDLNRRGPGEVYGTKQSGMLQFHFANLTDQNMIKTAGEIASQLLD